MAVAPDDNLKKLVAVMEARDVLIAAARKVHKKVTSKYRTQRCVLELKDAVEALEAVE